MKTLDNEIINLFGDSKEIERTVQYEILSQYKI